ncbi:methyl-accepting chemotaxis protein/methyl-accepting chemotaxis protein-1 (serine sensor receptor) [Granulicella aggregans]|jgi:methyl-accepting chemotaxis protein|uniref:Methyl-accepting chemotaxis protein/methyl-accepting chemotaxis protein-1 (Serine sensor receptor) n=1 Tax=Granulicella aggregans TaxID=474949 RepID=A0A7W8E5C2_9BACT|nr:methyl-accepting chemotaxis protein [Granulicella aggregans]MBB5059134.1 methyl-accepting chemotaxis protein/methyl-accepting chemotaxis protein-1 (serine sensor receptor) [Granulicella aggregans]
MSGWTVGKRVLGAFALTFGLIAALLMLFVYQTQQSNKQLNKIIEVYNKKLAIGSSVELATTEMQGAQRGLMLSYEAKDESSAPQYVNLYEESGKKIDSLLREMEPLAVSDAEHSALESVRSNRETWRPRFAELVQICKSGDIAKAYALRSQNKVISAAMHAGATAIVEEQHRSLAAAAAESSAAMVRAGWYSFIAACISFSIAGLVLFIVRQVNQELRIAATSLNEGAEEIASASGQVAALSTNLAQGANEQAAFIEETSAATIEITSMSRRSTDASQSTAAMFASSQIRFEEADRCLVEMENAMNGINTSTEQISRIIKVIEQIAFQTNILALNAAVEAARAGEAGAGFAVVADEVRSLAQRSAQAAKDTAEFIEDSIVKSSAGKEKVDQVATVIRAITGDSGKIKQLVDDIYHGSQEQLRGIDQVANSIQQIEKITQESAASAEECAASSEELAAQSEAIRSIVASLNALVGGAETKTYRSSGFSESNGRLLLSHR